MLRPEDFFDLDEMTAAFFEGCHYVWEAITQIENHVLRLVGNSQQIEGEVMPGAHLSHQPLFIGAGARIEPGAFVQGPAYIAPGVVVRHGAFIRENVIMLPGAILGHASEAKNALFLPQAQAPHFNYIGDSILGHKTNLGAGSKLSNLGVLSQKDALTGKRPSIVLSINGEQFDTGLAKFGAVLGDGAQTGCNVVLNPGCLLGKDSQVYANCSLRKGYYPPDSIFKLRQEIVVTEKRRDG